MKKSIIILAIVLLASCGKVRTGERYTKETTAPEHDYTVVLIDGCQYIEVNAGIGNNEVYSLTYKGDCTNPIHLQQAKD